MLTEWSKKWDSKIAKGPEFKEYSIYTAWEGLITEANATAALHSQSDSKLDDLCVSFLLYFWDCVLRSQFGAFCRGLGFFLWLAAWSCSLAMQTSMAVTRFSISPCVTTRKLCWLAVTLVLPRQPGSCVLCGPMTTVLTASRWVVAFYRLQRQPPHGGLEEGKLPEDWHPEVSMTASPLYPNQRRIAMAIAIAIMFIHYLRSGHNSIPPLPPPSTARCFAPLPQRRQACPRP